MGNYYGVVWSYGNSLSHHGIKGQRWGVRRFQNEDGTLTSLGRKRLGTTEEEVESNTEKARDKWSKASDRTYHNNNFINRFREKKAEKEFHRAEEVRDKLTGRRLTDKDAAKYDEDSSAGAKQATGDYDRFLESEDSERRRSLGNNMLKQLADTEKAWSEPSDFSKMKDVFKESAQKRTSLMKDHGFDNGYADAVRDNFRAGIEADIMDHDKPKTDRTKKLYSEPGPDHPLSKMSKEDRDGRMVPSYVTSKDYKRIQSALKKATNDFDRKKLNAEKTKIENTWRNDLAKAVLQDLNLDINSTNIYAILKCLP